MLMIECPWCGTRAETEFSCGGEAHIARPVDSDGLSDAAWADYLFMRKNVRGVQSERWCHSHGCGRWFNTSRDSVSDRIFEIYPMGSNPPEGDG